MSYCLRQATLSPYELVLHNVILENKVNRLSYVPSTKAGMYFKPGVWNDYIVIACFGIAQRYCKAEGTSSHLAGVGTTIDICFVGSGSHAENLC